MSTKADKKLTPEQPPTPVPTPHAVFVGLEDVAIAGRKIEYDILKKALADHKLSLTSDLFTRYCTATAAPYYLETLLQALNAKAGLAQKVLAEYHEALAAALSNPPKVHATITKFIQTAESHNITATIYSLLPEAVATALAAKLGLEGLKLFTFKEMDKVFPRSDTWLKMARALTKNTKNCLALVSNNASCKSAMFADVHTVVIPDEFTGFQDFGGAYAVLDDVADLHPQEIILGIFPELEK